MHTENLYKLLSCIMHHTKTYWWILHHTIINWIYIITELGYNYYKTFIIL